MLISGTTSTLAPRPSRRSTRSPACWTARVTMTRTPARGRDTGFCFGSGRGNDLRRRFRRRRQRLRKLPLDLPLDAGEIEQAAEQIGLIRRFRRSRHAFSKTRDGGVEELVDDRDAHGDDGRALAFVQLGMFAEEPRDFGGAD